MNKNNIIALLLIVFSSQYQLFGQQGARSYSSGLTIFDTSKTITVSGESEMEIAPDFFTLEIELSDAFCKKGESIETLYDKVKTALKAQKISLDSLKLKSTRKEESLNYNNSNDLNEIRKYHINLYSLDTFQKLVDVLDESQLISLKLLKSECRRLDAYKLKLYENAMMDAKSKAEVITQSTSQKIETALKIREAKFNRRRENTAFMSRSENGIDIEPYLLYLEVEVIYKIQ
jgi:uncharacterized protein YggE